MLHGCCGRAVRWRQITAVLPRTGAEQALRGSTRPSLLAQAIDTLVLLMGGSQLAVIAEQLQQAGRAAATPVAVVRSAALPAQRVWRGQLGSIAQQTAGERLSPCIIIVGEVSGGTHPHAGKQRE